MRSIVILTLFFLYASATPVKNEESNKNIEIVKNEEKGDIILDINEDNEDNVEGRDMLQGNTDKGRKTIHIHSPNTPNINIMPTKYQISANNVPPPYPAYGQPQQQTTQDNKLTRGRGDDKRSKPKNQVNIYVYFPNNTNDNSNNSMNDMMMGNRTTMTEQKKEQGVKEPIKQVKEDEFKPINVPGETVPKPTKKPSYVLACPKGHVRVLGACVEYDQD